MNPPMVPFGYQPYPPQHVVERQNEVPARVQVAISFLRDLTMKERATGVVGDSGAPLEIEGHEILPVEEQTRAAALHMLQTYFLGQMGPTPWEVTENGLDRASAYRIKCYVCQGAGCEHCNKAGTVIVERNR